jgi:hypothetical protein
MHQAGASGRRVLASALATPIGLVLLMRLVMRLQRNLDAHVTGSNPQCSCQKVTTAVWKSLSEAIPCYRPSSKVFLEINS